MLDALKFVQGAVARKGYVPALTHFNIKGGFVKGYNGIISLSSPIDLDFDVSPKAVPFAKAIATCKDTVVMSVTPTGRLSVKSGKFKAVIECVDEESFPDVQPSGPYIELKEGFSAAVKELLPFVGTDATRPWSTGVLFKGGSAFATNNVVLVERWLGYDFPVTVNIPASTLKELLRVKEEPIGLQMGNDSITFHFEGDRFMRSQVYSLEWPDMTKLLNATTTPTRVPDGFFEALADLTPFADDTGGRIFLAEGLMSTRLNTDEGATVEVDGIAGVSCYNCRQLGLLNEVIETLNLSEYPQPTHFEGPNLRGVIVGMRNEV